MALEELKENASLAVAALIGDQLSSPQDVYNALSEIKEDIDTALEVLNEEMWREQE